MKRYSIVGGLFGVFLLSPALLSAQKQADPLYVQRLAAAKALAKKAGFPLSMSEIPKRKVPDSENLAVCIRALNEIGKRRPLSEKDKLFLHGELQSERPLSAQQAARAKEIFASRADILQNLDKAAACNRHYVPPTSVFDDATAKSDSFAPIASGLHSAARWLNAKTGVLLAEGRNREAIANQSKALHLARVAQQDSSLMEVLVASALNAIATRGMEKILLSAGEKPGIAQAVEGAMQREKSAFSFQNVLHYELAMHLDVLEGTRKEAGRRMSVQEFLAPNFKSEAKKYGYPDDPKKAAERYINANETILILRFLELESFFPAPYYQKPPKGFPSQKDMESPARNPDSSFASISLPVYLSSRAVLARQEAMERSVLLGAKVLAWKVKHGAFPASLTEVVSSVPLDPFDGKPLRYRKEGAGFVVYSVGEKGAYDGRATPKGGKRESAFRYPAPPP